MSRLQNLVNSIVTIIINYTDPKQRKGIIPQVLITQSHEEIIRTLKNLIDEAHKTYQLRTPLLNYFLYELDSLKQLIDKPLPLNIEERKNVQQHLLTLITNTQKLLDTDKASHLEVAYDERLAVEERAVLIAGFKDVGSVYTTICRSGQVIQLWHANKAVFPTDSLTNVPAFLEQVIEEHQTGLLLPLLTKENLDLKETNRLLRESEESTKREKSTLQEKADAFDALTEKLRLLEDRYSALEKEKSQLQKEQEHIVQQAETAKIETTEKLEGLQVENTRLEEERESLAAENLSLRSKNQSLTVENSSLKRTVIARTPLVGMGGGARFFPLSPLLLNFTPSLVPAPTTGEEEPKNNSVQQL